MPARSPPITVDFGSDLRRRGRCARPARAALGGLPRGSRRRHGDARHPLRLLLVRCAKPSASTAPTSELLRDIGLNGSVVALVGSFIIGWIIGPVGLKPVAPFFIDMFRGLLCLFLLDMGIVAGRGLARARKVLSPPLLLFAIGMPLVSAALAAVLCIGLGLSTGGTMLFITLAVSASYIAVPAAMRLALPEAEPAIYLSLSLGVTFPFNLTLGLPLYLAAAERIAG